MLPPSGHSTLDVADLVPTSLRHHFSQRDSNQKQSGVQSSDDLGLVTQELLLEMRNVFQSGAMDKGHSAIRGRLRRHAEALCHKEWWMGGVRQVRHRQFIGACKHRC